MKCEELRHTFVIFLGAILKAEFSAKSYAARGSALSDRIMRRRSSAGCVGNAIERKAPMSRCLVTGAAGFIGSHLCAALLAKGHSVRGLDAFIPFYPRAIKERTLRAVERSPDFSFHELDLRSSDVAPLLQNVDVVFHLAAMPGLPLSWADFDLYMTCNFQATQRLLEAARGVNLKHFIYGSTSSVYGRFATGDEHAPIEPISPYGVTKLAAEQLCQAYSRSFGLPLTILRFFSVYGPGQRPDMAYNIFIRALLHNEPITMYGDGEQSRSNTFVQDCVEGIVLAFEQPERSVGEIFNLGGGEIVTMNRVLQMLEELTGIEPTVDYQPPRTGDQRATAADIGKAQRLLGYAPSTLVVDGLQAQIAWQREAQG
jgi:nucleoside-diphosphate-sugar epimerase